MNDDLPWVCCGKPTYQIRPGVLYCPTERNHPGGRVFNEANPAGPANSAASPKVVPAARQTRGR